MEIKQLKYFVVLARELNFTSASKILCISQPSVTRQIKSLEEELGVPLFVRTKNHVALSYEGAIFHDQALQILDSVDRSVLNMQSLKKGLSGKLKINFVVSGMIQFLPNWTKRFRAKYPNVELELKEVSGVHEVSNNLLEGKTDISFNYGIPNHPKIETQIVYKENVLYAIPNNHKLLEHDEIELTHLKGEPFIFFPKHLDPSWYNVFMKKCEIAGFTPNIVQHTYPMQARLNLVASGMGITFVAESLKKLGTPEIEYRYPIQEERVVLPVTMNWVKNEKNPIVQRFIEFTKT